MRLNFSKDIWFYGILLAAAGWVGATSILSPIDASSQVSAPQTGFAAPGFQLSDLNGSEIDLDNLRGQVVVLNLWASWCVPCRAEMPAIQKVYEAYSGEGLAVLGINMTNQDSQPAVEEFVTQNHLSFPILMDIDGGVGRLYHLRSLPTTYFIDRKGVIRDVVIGGPMPEALLKARVMELLGEKP